jgi:hypothetical protein
MGIVKTCDGCGLTENQTQIRRVFKENGLAPGREVDPETVEYYFNCCADCRARAYEFALHELAGCRHKANTLFLAAFKNISHKRT